MTGVVAPARDPVFTGRLDEDTGSLAACVEAHETELAGLPARPDRDTGQRLRADELLGRIRAARRAFLGRHADAVYDSLTDGRSRYVRLPDLVAAAARYAGLVPTGSRLAAERVLPQAHRDGLEIDLGIFCGAVLRSPAAGRHLIEAMLEPLPGSHDLLGEFRRAGRVELASVLVERQGDIAHVTFRNAHCLNAEDGRLIADLETAVDLVLLDDQVRVGVLRGGHVDHDRHRGRRVFSAGINLKELQAGRISLVDFLLGRELGYLHKIQRGLLVDPAPGAWSDRTVGKPWLGVVDSFAIGGGMQLLLVLDRVIAEDGSYASLPAAEEGIVPGLGNLRLTRVTGARLARQVILGGRRLAAGSPEGELLFDEVVPAAGLDAAADRAARELAAPAVAANRRMLGLAEEPLDAFREYLAEFAVVQPVRAHSADVLAKLDRRWAGGAG